MSRRDRRQQQRQNQPQRKRTKSRANPWILGLALFFALAFLMLYFVANSH